MEILGVGVPELAFIVLIALILLGPKDMVAAGRTMGRFLRKLITSPTWQAMRRTGEEIQQLPTKLMREAGLEDLEKEVQTLTNQIKPPDIKKSFDEALTFDVGPVLPNDPARPAEKSSPPSPGASNQPDLPSPVPTNPKES
jgi:Sec-independent protein translocase protein TatA